MKVGIYGQFYHENSGQYIETLLDILNEKDVSVVIEENFLKLIRENKEINKDYPQFSTFEELDHSYDLFFSIGGDGTILKTITYVRDLGIPIVGINTGRLGFLATIQKEHIATSVEKILTKDYRTSPRSLIQLETEEPKLQEKIGLNFALNEITISRKNSTSMISVETYLDGEYLTNFWADGLIISTPTGSTGYSLSCGGPVIMPGNSSFVLTPIAPHNLNARPLVVPDNVEISLKVSGREEDHLVSLDSRIASIPVETKLILKRTPFNINMVTFANDTFISTLRKKLMWGEDKRN